MTHDPLCPQYDCWLEGCTVCDECDLIAKVREDERAVAVQRVEALRRRTINARGFSYETVVLAQVIAAIKGEQE